MTAKRLILHGVFFFLFFVVTGSGHFYVGDEATRYYVTKSIVERGSLAIDWGYGDRDSEGRLYGKYGILQSVAAVPLYVAGRTAARIAGTKNEAVPVFFVSVFNAIVTAGVCVLVLLFVMTRFGLSARAAVATAWLFATCTMGWFYARTFFAEPLICLLLLGQLLGATSEGFRKGERGFLGVGLLGALCVLVRPETIVVAPVFFVAGLLSDGRRVRNAVLFSLPIAAAAGFTLWFNTVRFGSPFNFGYQGESFTTPMFKGLYLLLFSPGKSVFLYSPAILLCFIGAGRLWRTDRRAAVLAGALVVLMPLIYCRWNLPGGDMSWGPRYLLPCVLLMSFGILPGLAALRERLGIAGRALGAALIALSFGVQVLSVSVNFHTYSDMLYSVHNPNGIPPDAGMDSLHYVPLTSPISGHWQMLRFMIDKNYVPPFYDYRKDPASKALLERYDRPDFTIDRLFFRRGREKL